MRTTRLFAYILAALMTVACTNDKSQTKAKVNVQEEEIVEVADAFVDDEPEVEEALDNYVPEREKVPYLDDEKWDWTTLMHRTNAEVVFNVWQMDGLSYLVCNDKILYANPVMTIDSVAPDCWRVSTLKGNVVIDFSNKNWRRKISQLPHKLDNVTAFEHRYMRKEDTIAMRCGRNYFIRMEFPDSGRYSDKINKWLVDCLSDGIYADSGEEGKAAHISYFTGNVHDIPSVGKHLANQYFRNAPEVPIFYSNIYCTQDCRIMYETNKYITYQKYEYSFNGGAHGGNIERLISYDTANDMEINNKLLFKPGSDPAIRNLIYECARSDDHFRAAHGDISIERVAEIFNCGIDGQEFDIPQAGVTPKGLVFSFQPYQIGSFADGCFHITVPFAKAKPYLKDAVLSYFENI